MESRLASDPAVRVLFAGVLHLRDLEAGDLAMPAPHALDADGEWQPLIAVLAQCAGYVSLLLFDSDGASATEIAEVDVGALAVHDIQIIDDSLFGGCFGFRISLHAIAEAMRCGAAPAAAADEARQGTCGSECTAMSGSLPADTWFTGSGDGHVPDLGAPVAAARPRKSRSWNAGLAGADPHARHSGIFPYGASVASSLPATLYFAATRAHERNSWVGLLRRHARTFELTASGPAGPLAFRVERCLLVRVLGAQGLALPCNATAMVVAGGNLLAQTAVAPNTAAPRWEGAPFCFGGLGPDSASRLLVLVCQAGPGGSSGGGEGGLLGYSQIPLATLRRGHSYSGWYPLSYGDLAAASADCELGRHLRFAPNVRPACKREWRSQNHTSSANGSISSRSSSSSSSSSTATIADVAVPDVRPSIPFRSGDVQVQVRYDETIVLSRGAYRDVAALVLDTDPTLVFRFAELLPGSADWLVETVTKIAIWSGCVESWIEALVRHELGIRGDRDPALLFRGTTVATRAMDTLMKVAGLGFVDQLVGDVVRRVASNEYACEVDPARHPPGASVDVHWRALTRLLQVLWQRIEDGAAACPPVLRRVFCAIRRAVAAAFDRDALAQVRYSCVSSFVFLRLLCPAMLAPKGFGLVCAAPSAASLRTLTLLAKGIQCAANLNGSVGKEPYMQPMNAFVQTCVPRLKAFIDAIATPLDDPPRTADCTPIDGEHELAVLCAFVHASRDQAREALAAKYRLHTPSVSSISMPTSPTDATGRPAFVSLAASAGSRSPDATITPSSPSSPAMVPLHLGSAYTPIPHHCAAPLEYLAYASVERLIHECDYINDCVAHLHSHVDQPAVRPD